MQITKGRLHNDDNEFNNGFIIDDNNDASQHSEGVFVNYDGDEDKNKHIDGNFVDGDSVMNDSCSSVKGEFIELMGKTTLTPAILKGKNMMPSSAPTQPHSLLRQTARREISPTGSK